MSSTLTRISPADRGRKMTLEEFREAEERSGFLYELARGVLESTNVPDDSHGQIVHNVHQSISAYCFRNPGLILRIGHGSDIRFITPELASDRHPDLAVVFEGAPRDADGRRRADLAVEVVSRGKRSRRRDYDDKREEYLRLGLAEYWIVDPQFRQVMVLSRRDEQGVTRWEERIFRDGDSVVSHLLPEFSTPVGDFWIGAEPDDEAP